MIAQGTHGPRQSIAPPAGWLVLLDVNILAGQRPGTNAMREVTRILWAIEQGDPHAPRQVLRLVHDELRKLAAQRLAQEKPGQTFQATALVHEAYMCLVDTEKVPHRNSRGRFFATAEAMRRILVENARRKKRLKRGGAGRRIPKAFFLTRAALFATFCA